MRISKAWLEKQDACSDGIDWWEECGETDGIGVVKLLMLEKKYDWANWLIVRVMDDDKKNGYKMYVAYGVFAAEQVIHLFEEKYPNDKRPRQAIEVAKACIEKPSKENKELANAAWAAVWAARAAARAAAGAAGDAMQLKILNHGIKLLEGRG